MTTEAVEALQVFRAVTVEHRRQLVRNLAVPTNTRWSAISPRNVLEDANDN